jgi:hypothetical protein
VNCTDSLAVSTTILPCTVKSLKRGHHGDLAKLSSLDRRAQRVSPHRFDCITYPNMTVSLEGLLTSTGRRCAVRGLSASRLLSCEISVMLL